MLSDLSQAAVTPYADHDPICSACVPSEKFIICNFRTLTDLVLPTMCSGTRSFFPPERGVTPVRCPNLVTTHYMEVHVDMGADLIRGTSR